MGRSGNYSAPLVGDTMIYIDGAAGEGGGQVLRSAVGLSLLSGRPTTVKNIRAKRKKPGLMRQHLTAVLAAAEIGEAEVQGAKVGSRELIFIPKTIKAGSYRFAIGTAGSCTLVFQTILPALLAADSSSELVLEGGTHNPMAPPFDFLETSFLPLLRQMGAEVDATLDRPGFYPAGGGRITISIVPGGQLTPLELTRRSNTMVSAKAVCAQLPGHIGQRELKIVETRLKVDDHQLELVQLDSYGPGNVLTLFVRSDELTETFTGFGQKNISAEKVAIRAVKEVNDYLQSPAPVGPYLADQLLIPMVIAGRSTIVASKLSSHTVTNMKVIEQFYDVAFAIKELGKNYWELTL